MPSSPQPEGPRRLRGSPDAAPALPTDAGGMPRIAADGGMKEHLQDSCLAEETPRTTSQLGRRFADTILGSLPSHIAVVDPAGRIIEVNEPWTRFSVENGTEPERPAGRTETGTNYLEICSEAAARGCEEAAEAASGLLAVLARTAPTFSMEYSCHSPSARRWFTMTAAPLLHGAGGAVVVHADTTESVAARTALLETTARLRRFFETPLIGTCITSPAKGWLEVNDKLVEMLGFSREELRSLTWADLTHPEDLPLDLARFGEVLSGSRDGYSMEKRFVRKDGSVFPAEMSVSCVRKPDGSVDYVVALLRDITARIRAEEARAESERRFRLLAENATDAIGILGTDGVIRYISPSCKIVVGYDQSEMTWLRVADLYHPDDRQLVQRATERHIAGEPLVRARYRVFHKDGRTIWIERTTRAIRDPRTGEITEFQFSVRDITEAREAAQALRRDRSELERAVAERTATLVEANARLEKLIAANAEAEKALQESEERYRLFFDNSLDAVLLTIPDWGIIAANPATCQMVGKSEDEILAGGRSGLLDETDPRLSLLLEERARTGRMRGEVTALRADGTRFPVELVSSAFVDTGGRRLAASIFRDLSSQKRAEEERERLLERVRLLAARASNASENEGRRLARDLHDKVGHGLATLGLHIGALRSLLGASGHQKARTLLDEAAGQVEETVAQLRLVMADLRPPALDELGLVPALRHFGEKLARLAGFELTVSGDEASSGLSPVAQTAAFRIGQEALANTARHSGARHVRVTLSSSGPGIRLSIEDDGSGFDPALVPATDPAHLGLVGMQERAEAAGGGLTVESAPGRGTRIVLEIPEAIP